MGLSASASDCCGWGPGTRAIPHAAYRCVLLSVSVSVRSSSVGTGAAQSRRIRRKVPARPPCEGPLVAVNAHSHTKTIMFAMRTV